MGMTALSVVIITFNEERNIARCINSVKDIADEIVVVDSYSTDNTKNICKSFGVRFYEHVFEGHKEQKNWAIQLAANPFVLSLDADECLSRELLESIQELKVKGFEKPGYYMNRLTNYCGQWVRHSGWYPDRKLRLWDRSMGSWKGLNPHDEFIMNQSAGKPGFIVGDILHYSYYTKEDHYKQLRYFSDLSAKSYFDAGKKTRFWNLILNPIACFISHYIIHLGFLDGVSGWQIAKLSAYATYLKYQKLKHLARD